MSYSEGDYNQKSHKGPQDIGITLFFYRKKTVSQRGNMGCDVSCLSNGHLPKKKVQIILMQILVSIKQLLENSRSSKKLK